MVLYVEIQTEGLLNKGVNIVEEELDNIMEDLIMGHNFDFARKAIIDWHNDHLNDRIDSESKSDGFVKLIGMLKTLELSSDDIILIKEALENLRDSDSILNDISKPQSLAINQRIQQISEKLGKEKESQNE